MTNFIRSVCILAALGAAGATARAENKLPEAAATILAKAEQIEVFSLDPAPDPEKPKESFHGIKVSGKTTLKGDAKKDLAAAFEKGLEGKIDPARCFNPRHAIRATFDGKSVDLLICFECSQFKVFMGKEDKGQTLLVNKKPEPAFDKVLKDAGLEKGK